MVLLTFNDLGLFCFFKDGSEIKLLDRQVLTFKLLDEMKISGWYVEDSQHRYVSYEQLRVYAAANEIEILEVKK